MDMLTSKIRNSALGTKFNSTLHYIYSIVLIGISFFPSRFDRRLMQKLDQEDEE